ncbi:hypothetical protein AgCh_031519 [Apium graveolens]
MRLQAEDLSVEVGSRIAFYLVTSTPDPGVEVVTVGIRATEVSSFPLEKMSLIVRGMLLDPVFDLGEFRWNDNRQRLLLQPSLKVNVDQYCGVYLEPLYFFLETYFVSKYSRLALWYMEFVNIVFLMVLEGCSVAVVLRGKIQPKKATHSKKNSSSLAEGPVINEILDLLHQQQQQQLQLIQQIQQQQHQQGELNQTTSFKSFQSVKPPEFKGEVDPIVARNWLKEMEKAFTLTQKARRFQQGLKPEIRRGVVALQLKTYSSMVQAALVMESDQKLAIKEESDKKRKSEGVMNKADQGESSQEFENRFGRNRSMGFRRQSLFQARSSATSVAFTPAQSVKSAVDCKSCDRRHSGVTCYNCGKDGHIARSFRTVTQDTTSQGPTSSTARGRTFKRTKRSSVYNLDVVASDLTPFELEEFDMILVSGWLSCSKARSGFKKSEL